MAKYITKLHIAGIIIQMQSSFALKQLTGEENKQILSERFNAFDYQGNRKAQILINIEIVKKLPQICNTKHLFTTYHFQDGSENWCLLKKDNIYIYKSLIGTRKQLMLINKTFDRVTAYLFPKDEEAVFLKEQRKFMRENKRLVWNKEDIIYDFLQVLLINYFAQRNAGIFTHAVGVRDINGKGLLFAGKSGAGKSTTARLWHKQSRAMVLNDDRIIIRKLKGKFFIYGSPWHGEFSDYLASRIESAPLEKLFFIHHTPENTVRQISEKEAFRMLYPTLFPTFWDKRCLENIVSFCQNLIEKTPCYNLGFVNDNRIIRFVRTIK